MRGDFSNFLGGFWCFLGDMSRFLVFAERLNNGDQEFSHAFYWLRDCFLS